MRSWINEVLNSNREQFEDDLKALEPHQRVALMEKLLSYVIPKMQSISSEDDKDNSLTIIWQETKTYANEKEVE